MTIELTAERALELLREVVTEYGENYVYENPVEHSVHGCLYVHGDQPGCIAGHVYHRAGLSLATLRGEEGTHANTDRFREIASGDGTAVVRRAQHIQDIGGTWGKALTAAERAARAE